jgi:hypothetical protein
MTSLELASSRGRGTRTVPGRMSDVCSLAAALGCSHVSFDQSCGRRCGKPLRGAGARRIDGQIVPSATSAEASLDRSFDTDLFPRHGTPRCRLPAGASQYVKEHYAGATLELTARYMRQPQYWMVVSRDVSCVEP